MEALIKPEHLKKGDKIGILAPSRSIRRKELEPFIRLMKNAGFIIELGEHVYGSEGQFSGTIEERLIDFRQLFTNPSIKAVFAARGGYGAAQLLLSMDWEMIRENPKWLIGFSDLTALQAAFGKFIETIHGIMPFSLCMEEPQLGQSVNTLLDILTGEKYKYTLENHAFNVEGEVRGLLAGGNLSVLFSLAGTPFEPDYEGKILFIEDLDEYLYHIDRMILNFELRDIFRKISGLVVGDFSSMHDNTIPFGKNAYEIIAERALKYNVPTVFGFPAGHKKNNLPLIFGRVTTLTVKEGMNSLEID